jgi:alpha-D-ribose 1-methylphosphonate 5-triphosphate diphosphatase PhnM
MRTWRSVRRWITFALLAACANAIAHTAVRAAGSRLTVTGLARLYGEITRTRHDDEFHDHWIEWICDHNEQAANPTTSDAATTSRHDITNFRRRTRR